MSANEIIGMLRTIDPAKIVVIEQGGYRTYSSKSNCAVLAAGACFTRRATDGLPWCAVCQEPNIGLDLIREALGAKVYGGAAETGVFFGNTSPRQTVESLRITNKAPTRNTPQQTSLVMVERIKT